MYLTKRFRIGVLFISGIFASCGLTPESNQSESTSLPESTSSPAPIAQIVERSFDPSLDIGIVLAGSECSELLIRNKGLVAGDQLQVVLADDRPHKKLLATVVGPNNCPRSPQSAIQEIVIDGHDSPPTEYEIRFVHKDELDSGFAVMSAKATVLIEKGVAKLTAGSLTTTLGFRTCTGNESYHMTVWEGKPLVGKRVWYGYWSLSYGTVPTCRPADYK